MSIHRFWTSAGLGLGYFSGLARFAELGGGGAGVVLRFERVRPRRSERFQPLRSREITPQFLDRLLRALKRWRCEIVSPDDVVARLEERRLRSRFVCLTFDGGSRDIATFAHPILARHGVPFAVYLPTAFPDGIGEAWWLALEQVITTHERIALVIDHNERWFDTAKLDDKYRVFYFLGTWLRALGPAELHTAIHDLCIRYSVDLKRVTREAVMNWEEVARLAADPKVTIGSATVNYALLANTAEAVARKEITMGRAVLEAALGRSAPHFAFPFGETGTFTARHVEMVEQAGFTSAMTSIPGMIDAGNPPRAHMLPRISWDGRRTSLRDLRVVLSGLMPRAAAAIGR